MCGPLPVRPRARTTGPLKVGALGPSARSGAAAAEGHSVKTCSALFESTDPKTTNNMAITFGSGFGKNMKNGLPKRTSL